MSKNKWNLPVSLYYWDAIVSLGGSCQVAEQLKRWNLRPVAYPFDWLFSLEGEYVIEALKNRFEGFLDFENLTESPTQTEHRRITDTRYHMIHQHIFPLDVPWEESYPAVKRTADRRIQRLLDLRPGVLGGGKDILFIRTNLTAEQGRRLAALLTEQFGGGAYLMAVNHTKNARMRSVSLDKNFGVYEIYDESEDRAGDRWQGYNPHWDRLLFPMRLKEVSIVRDDALCQNFYPCEAERDGDKRRFFRWSKERSVLKLESYMGYQCAIVLDSSFPVSVRVTDTLGNAVFIKRMGENGSVGFAFPVTHLTRWVAISVGKTWRPCDKYRLSDERELGVRLSSVKLRVSKSEENR